MTITEERKTNLDNLRPTRLDEFFGQPLLKRRLKIKTTAALEQVRPLEHVLLAGQPGTGKTSMAELIADLVKDPCLVLSMPVPDAYLRNVVGDFVGVLVLDEVHRTPERQQENLLPLLERGYLVDGNGERIKNEWLTIIGTTTEPRKVIPPLYDRFTYKPVMEPYTVEDMTNIILSMARKAGVELAPETARELAPATGGIPRAAREIVQAARDINAIGRPITVGGVLALAAREQDGLTEQHLYYLEALELMGGTAGLKLIATTLNLHESICLDLETALVAKGFISRGSTGRTLLSAGRARLRVQ